MTRTDPPRGARTRSGARASVRARGRWARRVRRVRLTQRGWFVALVVLLAAAAVAANTWQLLVSLTVLVLPMMLATLVLGPRLLPWFVVLNLLMLSLLVLNQDDVSQRNVSALVVIFLLGFIFLLSGLRRSRLGVSGPRGESMLVDLRDRISNQGRVPALPEGWYVEAVMRSAGGSSFAGDFIATSKSVDDTHLELVVVDVSGKGEQAGTRALLLSGAFGGLLGALPGAAFLPAANDYLQRQEWAEGFASAIQLSLNLVTGEFELYSAGHPPAVQLLAGSGRWVVHNSEGPVLGLMDDAEFVSVRGHIRSGDAVLLYTDGLVETPERDISMGIDKLVGQGERLFRAGFDRGARKLIDRLESTNDDRALVLVHRR